VKSVEEVQDRIDELEAQIAALEDEIAKLENLQEVIYETGKE
jgi:prefoldin subunit 5